MRYINTSDKVRRVVRHRVKTAVKPGEVVNLDVADINHSSSALRFFEPYTTEKEEKPMSEEKSADLPNDEELTDDLSDDKAPTDDLNKDPETDGEQTVASGPDGELNVDVTETPAEDDGTDKLADDSEKPVAQDDGDAVQNKESEEGEKSEEVESTEKENNEE